MALLITDITKSTQPAAVYIVDEPGAPPTPNPEVLTHDGWKVFIVSGTPIITDYIQAIFNSIKPEEPTQYTLDLLESLTLIPGTELVVLYQKPTSHRHHVVVGEGGGWSVKGITAPEGMANWHRYYTPSIKHYPDSALTSFGWVDKLVEPLAAKYIQHGVKVLDQLKAGGFITDYRTYGLGERAPENYTLPISQHPHDALMSR